MLIIDRFEGDWAVIEHGEKFFNIPKELLPPDAKEGDIIHFSITIDQNSTKKQKERIQDLVDDLFG